MDLFKVFAAAGVPVFFLISGYYVACREQFDYVSNLKKKIKTLVIPYFSFILLYTVMNMVCFHLAPGMFDDYTTFSFIDWFEHIIAVPFSKYPLYYEPLWFLRDLILLNVLLFILFPIVKKVSIYITIPLMVILELLPLPSNLRYAIAFFTIGMSLGNIKRMPVLNIKLTIPLMILCFGISVCASSSFADQIIVLPMAYAIISLSEHLVKNPKIAKATKLLIPFSFIIYLTHQHPITLVQKLLAMKLTMTASIATLFYFTLPVFIIIACCLFAIMVKKVMPKTYRFMLGSR